MITYVKGNLFTSPAEVLVNTVNTVGVMGKGIAQEFKRFYPEMFSAYQKECENGRFDIGQLMLHRTENKIILNFPTKRTWRRPSKIQYVESGLDTFRSVYERLNITSISFPQLGCGNGELNWDNQVKPLMESKLQDLPISVFIHLYDQSTPILEHRDRKAMESWLRSEPDSLSFDEVWEDLSKIPDSSVQFAAEAGDWLVEFESNESEVTESAIHFSNPDVEMEVKWEDLRDLWQRFRDFGFLSEDDLSTEFRGVVDPLFDLLSHLDYVRPLQFSKQIGQKGGLVEFASTCEDDVNCGLQLVPAFVHREEREQLSFDWDAA